MGKKLRLAIISDLHCHPERSDYNRNQTVLFSDKLRAPSNEHPVENLLEIIANENIEVDLVLSPGDFTDQSDKQGFFSGWSYITELSRAMRSKSVVATIGNHDIDSRHSYSQYSFDIPKKIKQNFPLSQEYLGAFWDKGFTFIEEPDYQILVINSTHFHTHYDEKQAIENPAVKGKVDKDQIEEIEKYLELNKNANKIKIAMCHHHPINHSRGDLGEHDVVQNGSTLLAVLGKYKYDFFIHGHKHDPWLRYVVTDEGYQLPILAAGSFSATNQISYISKFNYFHVIEISKNGVLPAQGKIKTWTFKNKIGWKNDKDDGFYPKSGFGYLGSLSELVKKIKTELEATPMVLWKNLVEKIPEIDFLTPDMMEKLEEELEEEKIYMNSKIGLGPKHIYYERV